MRDSRTESSRVQHSPDPLTLLQANLFLGSELPLSSLSVSLNFICSHLAAGEPISRQQTTIIFTLCFVKLHLQPSGAGEPISQQRTTISFTLCFVKHDILVQTNLFLSSDVLLVSLSVLLNLICSHLAAGEPFSRQRTTICFTLFR